MAFTFKKNKDISDIIVVQPKVFWDERWFFMETYNQKEFADNWIDAVFIQDNHSKSAKWIFRWFHFQTQNTQSKLVRVLQWSVLDFAVDIRKLSETYGKYIVELLSAENKRQLFVPKWFAHGFISLEDATEFAYKCDDLYNPQAEWWIAYNDPDINIPREEIMKTHTIQDILLSEKDKKNIHLKDFDSINPF
jgi:dTDP-4-dehydrorhamnose 3,5-epimerase